MKDFGMGVLRVAVMVAIAGAGTAFGFWLYEKYQDRKAAKAAATQPAA